MKRLRQIQPGIGARALRYETTFPLNENPLSEGSAWVNTGTLWTKVETSGGFAMATQTGSEDPPYDDSYAYLSPSVFTPRANYRVTIVCHAEGTIGGNQEVECLLRWADSATVARGYEVLLPRNGSSYGPEFVRWNGGLGSFTYIHQYGTVAVQDGDVWQAEIVGTNIAARLIRSGSVVWEESDTILTDKDGNALAPWNDGQPGIGFFRRNTSGVNTTPVNWCATSFEALAL